MVTEALTTTTATTTEMDDGKRRWRKYGEKRVKMDCGGLCRRSYYRCSAFHGCPARKLENHDLSTDEVGVSYQGHHVHCEVINDAGFNMPLAPVPAMQVLGNYGTTPVVTPVVTAMTPVVTATTTSGKPPPSKPKTKAGIKRRYRQLSELNANVVYPVPVPEQPRMLAPQVQTDSSFTCRTIDLGYTPDLYHAAAVNTSSALLPAPQRVMAMNPPVNMQPNFQPSTAEFWVTNPEMAQHGGNVCIRSLAGENKVTQAQPLSQPFPMDINSSYGGLTNTWADTYTGIPTAKVIRPSLHAIPSLNCPTGLPSPTCLSSPA